MIKIWAKIMQGDKLQKSIIYQQDVPYQASDFLSYVTEICYELDIPTPMILKSHRYNFLHFNIARFRKTNFIESVPFDMLILENAIE